VHAVTKSHVHELGAKRLQA